MVLFKGDHHLTVPVELHVKPVFLALSRGRAGTAPPPRSAGPPPRGAGADLGAALSFHRRPFELRKVKNKVLEANVTILSSARSKIKEALKT